MRYPEIGEEVRVKDETGLLTVVRHIKPGRIELSDGRIFWLSGVVTRHQKHVTEYIVQGHYGGREGWEDVGGGETLPVARADLKDYRANDREHPYRMIRRKVLNPLYQGA